MWFGAKAKLCIFSPIILEVELKQIEYLKNKTGQ